ncbi:MAG: hypothetical protein ACI83D_000188 [Planctomycetota bacterium]|jgi:hypothetical protein
MSTILLFCSVCILFYLLVLNNRNNVSADDGGRLAQFWYYVCGNWLFHQIFYMFTQVYKKEDRTEYSAILIAIVKSSIGLLMGIFIYIPYWIWGPVSLGEAQKYITLSTMLPFLMFSLIVSLFMYYSEHKGEQQQKARIDNIKEITKRAILGMNTQINQIPKK